MKKSASSAIVVFCLILLIAACARKKSGLAEDSFLGEWYTIKGDVEAYSFLKDDTSFIFTGTQGMRPVIYGKWRIDKDKFVIIMDNGTTTSYSFNLSNDTLTFNDGAEIYTRTAPIEVQFPEVRILRDLKSDLGLDFSEPRPAEINWGEWIDSTQTSKDFTVKGFTVSLGSTLSSGDIARISGFLTDYGFDRDTIYVTEICSGFRDNNQLVTLCTSQDPESMNDSISITVSSGFVAK